MRASQETPTGYKIEKAAALRDAAKTPNDNLEPAEPADQPSDDDDRAKYGAGRFDPSAGDQAQKTPKHPVGDALVPVPSKAEYERTKFQHDARENRAFRDNERAMIQDMKDKIDASNKLRWN